MVKPDIFEMPQNTDICKSSSINNVLAFYYLFSGYLTRFFSVSPSTMPHLRPFQIRSDSLWNVLLSLKNREIFSFCFSLRFTFCQWSWVTSQLKVAFLMCFCRGAQYMKVSKFKLQDYCVFQKLHFEAYFLLICQILSSNLDLLLKINMTWGLYIYIIN